MNIHKVYLTAILAALLLASPGNLHARASYLSLEGRWRESITGSHLPNGFPTGQNRMRIVTKDDGQILQFEESWTASTGQIIDFDYKGTYNGKRREATNGQLMSFRHRDVTSFRIRWQTPIRNLTCNEICTFSPSGRKLTCRGTAVDASSQKMLYVDEWDRIQ